MQNLATTDRAISLIGPDGKTPLRDFAVDELGEKRAAAGGRGSGDLSQLGPMLHDLLGGGTSTDSWSPRESIARNIHWVFVCVRAIRDAVLKIPFRLYVSEADGETQEITDPQVNFNLVFNDPNPLDTRADLWSWTMTWLELLGNSLWLKVRDGFGVRELWPMPVHRMKPAHTKQQPLVGYLLDLGGSELFIPREDIVHLQYQNPNNRFWGIGTLAHACQAIKAFDKIRASQMAAFENEILASVYFWADNVLNDQSFERMRRQLLDRYGGPGKKGLPLILEGGTKVSHFQRPPAEMDYRDSEAIKRDEILAIFGVPPIMAGIVDNANRSNSEVQKELFLGNTVHPRLIRIQEKVTQDEELVPDRHVAEFDNPVPEDEAKATNRWTKHSAAGNVAPNEPRRAMGLEDQPWGEKPQWVWKILIENPDLPDLSDAGLEEFRRKREESRAEMAASLAGDGGNDQAGQASDPPPPNDQGSGDDDQGAAAESRSVQDGQAARSTGDSQRSAPVQIQKRAKLSESPDIIREIDEDLATLEKRTARSLRRYFSDQLDRVLANVRRLFEYLPESRTWRTVVRQVVIMDVDGEPCRLFDDGTLIREAGAYLHGRSVLGHAVAPECCMHNSGFEVATVEVRQLDPEFLDQLDDWRAAADMLAGRMLPIIEAAMKAGAETQSKLFPVEGQFDLRNPEAEQFLSGKQRDYWQGTVNETTKNLLSEKLAGIMADEPTVDKLEKAVKEVFGGETKGKPGGGTTGQGRFASARTIARTEVIGAYGAGSDTARTNAGVQKKEWMATFDTRTRPSHYAADGQIVAQSATFSVGGAQLRYPGDPNGPVREIVNCRCAAGPVIEDDDNLVDQF